MWLSQSSGSDAGQSCWWSPTFQRIISPPSSGCNSVEVIAFVRNTGTQPQDCTESQCGMSRLICSFGVCSTWIRGLPRCWNTMLYEAFAVVAWPVTGSSSMLASHMSVVRWLWVQILLSVLGISKAGAFLVSVCYSGLAGCLLRLRMDLANVLLCVV